MSVCMCVYRKIPCIWKDYNHSSTRWFSVPGETGATKLEHVTPGLQAQGLSHFHQHKLHISPERCQVNQTHAPRMSPTREAMSSTPRSGSASQAAEERRSDIGNLIANSADDAGKPQFPRAAQQEGQKASKSQWGQKMLARKTLAREGLQEGENSLGEAAHSRTRGLPSHNPNQLAKEILFIHPQPTKYSVLGPPHPAM